MVFSKIIKNPKYQYIIKDMGELTHDKPGALWEGKYMTSIFGETAEIDLTVYPDFDGNDKITTETEEAFRYYCQHRDDINDKIERELRNEYNLDDEFVMSSRFKPCALILLVEGIVDWHSKILMNRKAGIRRKLWLRFSPR